MKIAKKMGMARLAGLALSATMFLGTNAIAFDIPDVTLEGDVRGFGTGAEIGDLTRDVEARDIHLKLAGNITETISYRARLDLAHLFGLDPASDRFQEALEAIVITWKRVDNQFVRVIEFGKMSVFGSLVDAGNNPILKDSLTYGIRTKGQVMAIAIQTNPELLGKAISAAVFECVSGNLSFEDCVGFSASVDRINLGGNFYLNAELMGSQIDSSDDWEKRAKVALIYDGGQGDWVGYLEGTAFENVPGAEKSNFAVTAGATLGIGPGDVVVEVSWIEDVAAEAIVAYNVPIGAYLIFSPYIQFQEGLNGGADDVTVGANLRAKISALGEALQ